MFVAFLIIFGLFFFASLINVTEIGYALSLQEGDFDSVDDYLGA